MAIHDRRKNIEYIPDDLRLLCIMHQKLREQGYSIPERLESKFDYINLFVNIFKDKDDIFLQKLQSDCEKLFIPLSEFDWIKSDRAIFYVWGKVRTFNYSNAIHVMNNFKPFYECINLDNSPTTSNERKKTIIDFFDKLPEFSSNKTKILHQFKLEWSNIYNQQDPFKWIDSKNEDQCKRVWKNIKKNLTTSQNFNPTNIIDIYNSIYASFDLWIEDSEVKKRFLLRLSKNEYQKKSRDKITKKLILNTYISKEAKEKLIDLAVTNNKNINEIIEYLIENEFKKQNNQEKK